MPFDADIIEILKQNREIDKKLLLEQEKLRSVNLKLANRVLLPGQDEE